MPLLHGNGSRRSRSGKVDNVGLALAIGGLVMLAILIASRYSIPPDYGTTHPSVGVKLAPFEVFTDKNQSIVTTGSARANLVHLWGPWCGPCVGELPLWAELEKKYRDNSTVGFFAVSCGTEETDPLDRIVRETGDVVRLNAPGFRTYYDPTGSARRAILYPVKSMGFPTTVLLDRDRVVRGVWIGADPKHRASIEAAVAELAK